MSSAVQSKPATATQRSAAAVEHATEIFKLEDAKRLSAALIIAAVDGLPNDTSLMERVRTIYEDLAPKRVSAAKGKIKASDLDIELKPVKSMEGRFRDPSAPVDPYFLLELYGPDQLALALSRYTAPRLREGVKAVQARHPGTKPGGTGKQALIDYVVTSLVPVQL
jgi:hypothetical protein